MIHSTLSCSVAPEMVAVQTSSAAHTSSHHSFDSCQLKQCVIRSNSEQWDTQCKQCTNVLFVSLESRVPTSLLPTTEPNPVAPSHIICRHGLQRHYIIYLTTLFLSLSLFFTSEVLVHGDTHLLAGRRLLLQLPIFSLPLANFELILLLSPFLGAINYFIVNSILPFTRWLSFSATQLNSGIAHSYLLRCHSVLKIRSGEGVTAAIWLVSAQSKSSVSHSIE